MRITYRLRRGFTLVEIMIVVAIVGLLSSMAVPTFVRARANSREKVCLNGLRQLDGAKDQAALENGIGDGNDVSAFVELYLKYGVPVCPEGNTSYDLKPVGEPPECQSGFADAHNDAYQN